MDTKTKNRLWRLRKTCLKAADAAFSCWPKEYAKHKANGRLRSPLEGHCAAVAYMVQAVCGGDIVGGRVKDISHYWNRLPSGVEVDLTSCQFGGDGITPFKKGRKYTRKKGSLVNLRFLMFAQRVKELL